MIIEVFSSDKLPACKMSVRKLISLESRISDESGLLYAKRDLARALAERIMGEERLFSSERFGSAGQDMLGISLDCIVLSEAELRSLLNETFNKGVLQGRRGL
jgi:hypothetical protein